MSLQQRRRKAGGIAEIVAPLYRSPAEKIAEDLTEDVSAFEQAPDKGDDAESLSSCSSEDQKIIAEPDRESLVQRIIDERRRQLDAATASSNIEATTVPLVAKTNVREFKDRREASFNSLSREKKLLIDEKLSLAEEFPSRKETRCVCGASCTDSEEHQKTCQTFRDIWEAAIHHFVEERGVKRVRRIVNKVCSHRLSDDGMSLCALVESRGDVEECVRRLSFVDYRREMQQVAIRFKVFITLVISCK